MQLRIFALLAFSVFLVGCLPVELTTMVNTTNTPITLQIHHDGETDPRFAAQVVEVPAHASTPGPDFWNASVAAIGPDGSILFHQDSICPKVLDRDYVAQDRVWFSTRCKIWFAIEKDGIYPIPVKYWDSVDSHLDEIRKRP